jgi:hypothetical protein
MQSGQQEYWLADSIVAEKAISRLSVGPVIARPWRCRAYMFQPTFAASCCFTTHTFSDHPKSATRTAENEGFTRHAV